MKKIKSSLKFVTKISTQFILSQFKVYLLGILSTIVYLIIGSVVLKSKITDSLQLNPEASFFKTSLMEQPVSTILFVLIFLIFIFFIPIFAIKFGKMKILSLIVKTGSENMLLPVFDNIFLKYKNKPIDAIQTSSDFVLNKIKIINDVKHSVENRVIKFVLVFILKKIKFEDISSFQSSDDIYEFVKSKTLVKLVEFSNPSLKPLFTFIFFQFICLIFIYLF